MRCTVAHSWTVRHPLSLRCMRRVLGALIITIASISDAAAALCDRTAGWKPDPFRVRGGELQSLCGADLSKTDLSRATLVGADLADANLSGAILEGANLIGARLSKARLDRANLSRATLESADLSEALLVQAILTGANLLNVNLSQAAAVDADFSRALLQATNLSRADLSGAKLAGAVLISTNLERADFLYADLDSVTFEPALDTVNTVVNIEHARNLSTLTYQTSPAALVRLRERFAAAGFRDQEREVTHAKLRMERLAPWVTDSGLGARVGSVFSYAAFEITCGYGLWYGRPLKILLFGVPLFAVIYAIGLRSQGRAAIWRVWLADRVEKSEGLAEPERLSWETSTPGRSRRTFALRLGRALGLGLLFSLLSAFQIGWRELNVGNWITRLQPREYTLRATGWVRVVSGVQSLLSVYLLALWVLTYFGRPFE